jgi:hypothetical protein
MAKRLAGKLFINLANGMSVNKVSDFSRVNQRLLQSRFLLQQARNLSQEFLSPLQYDALINSVLMHMQLALVFYWRELGSYSRLKNAYQIQSLQDLQSELSKQNLHSQIIEELIDLQSAPGSWLRRLQLAINQLTLSESPQPEAKAFVTDDNQIPLVQIDEDQSLSLDDLEKMIQEFMLLTQRQRVVLAEF